MRRTIPCLLTIAGIIACTVPASSAVAGTIDFEQGLDRSTLRNGQSLTTTNPYGDLFRLTSSGRNQGAALFDSTRGVNTADRDLWVGLGNVLILQSNDNRQRSGDVFTRPNDSARGGRITFDFRPEAVQLNSVDVIDVDRHGSMSITLYDTSWNRRRISVPQNFTGDISKGGIGWATIDLMSGVAQESLEQPGLFTRVFTDHGFDASHVVKMQIALCGSGAIDNITYASMIPLPPAAWIGVAGLGGLVLRRRSMN